MQRQGNNKEKQTSAATEFMTYQQQKANKQKF